ncbi:Translin [Dothidotthia symphoricarpi CBS 119687]|uniref:Translin n=1 Tax=Dothidotthia symphoricarpi CBS 119687 TaxID=1392245 RepID=A0A6A6A528_9PLEO|nr:Translin [Dothidotthia symphoricarpi CBS 119687]KAF2126646.1 Translin [Dothidotthia symphoricarpi CBS 119687]
MAGPSGIVDPAIFQSLQSRIDEDSAVRDELKDIISALEKHNRNVSFVLSRAHSTPVANLDDVLKAAEEPIKNVVETVSKLSQAASKLPYYKFNNMWSRQMQGAIEGLLFWGWLGGYKHEGGEPKCGRLLTIEELGEILNIPVNLKERDEFHLTLEEYLQSLISLVEELTRLARNAVTLGDYERPLLINQFVKDLFAGFQILNLKNDSLRRRSDGLKYRVKDVEDVVYDLSLRNLVPKKGGQEGEVKLEQ